MYQKIVKPPIKHIFKRKYKNQKDYSFAMMEHIQELENYLKAVNDLEEYGPGICQIWTRVY